MTENTILRVVVPLSFADETRSLIVTSDGESSEPQPSSSTADPLNAPVTGGDIQAAAVVITAVFTAATTALTFLERLKSIRKDKRGRVEVTNARTDVKVEVDDAADLSELL